MAAEHHTGISAPPLVYRLDEVSISLTRQPGSSTAPIQRINLSGTGSATLERGGQRMPFRYTPKDTLALLNALYKMRFFDLPTNYITRYSVFLKDDDTVGTSALRMPDASSTSVCVTLTATYEKCVSYGAEGPYELENITARIFAEADRLANVK